MNKNMLLLVIPAAVLLAGCGAGGAASPTGEPIPTVIADSTIIAEGRLEPIHYAEIAFTASGRISQVLVEEGQSVAKGASLIRLGDESDSQYAAAQLELVSAEKALNDLSNAAGADLAQAVIDLKDAQEEYEKAANYLTYLQNTRKVPQTETRLYLVQTWKGYEYRTKTRHFKGPAPQDWIVDAENDLALKTARLDDAQRRYDRLKGGADVEQLAVLEAQLAAARARLAGLEVTAPFDGVVADLSARVGGSINAGEPAVTLADFSEWIVTTTDLTEIDVVQLEEGQPVTVTLDALPEAELAGTILSIGQVYSENQGDIVYDVTILLAETHPAMRWGMTAAVKFDRSAD